MKPWKSQLPQLGSENSMPVSSTRFLKKKSVASRDILDPSIVYHFILMAKVTQAVGEMDTSEVMCLINPTTNSNLNIRVKPTRYCFARGYFSCKSRFKQEIDRRELRCRRIILLYIDSLLWSYIWHGTEAFGLATDTQILAKFLFDICLFTRLWLITKECNETP